VGLHYFCLATNVSRRMATIKWVLETSLTKTLASKFGCRVSTLYRRYRVSVLEHRMLRVILRRADKEPLVATFGGFALERNPEGMGMRDFAFNAAWFKPGDKRSEVVQRLRADRCELCEAEGSVEVHHIRKLADIDRAGRRPKADWEKIMAARRRKTLVVCKSCHDDIHAGRYDGPAL